MFINHFVYWTLLLVVSRLLPNQPRRDARYARWHSAVLNDRWPTKSSILSKRLSRVAMFQLFSLFSLAAQFAHSAIVLALFMDYYFRFLSLNGFLHIRFFFFSSLLALLHSFISSAHLFSSRFGFRQFVFGFWNAIVAMTQTTKKRRMYSFQLRQTHNTQNRMIRSISVCVLFGKKIFKVAKRTAPARICSIFSFRYNVKWI